MSKKLKIIITTIGLTITAVILFAASKSLTPSVAYPIIVFPFIDIIAELDSLPRVVRETQRITGFGYHDKPGAKSNPSKWEQIDMGESVSPDAVALSSYR